MTSRTYHHRLSFQRATTTVEASGQKTRQFAEQFARRGRVTRRAAGPSEVSGQAAEHATFEIELPFDSALAAVGFGDWRIVWKDTADVINVTGTYTDRSSRRPVTKIEGTIDR